eukprot:5840286-Amphidinium_carterae.1
MTGPANVGSLRSAHTFVRKLQGSSVAFKLMCNDTSVRTGMSGTGVVEPTWNHWNGNVPKVLH